MYPSRKSSSISSNSQTLWSLSLYCWGSSQCIWQGCTRLHLHLHTNQTIFCGPSPPVNVKRAEISYYYSFTWASYSQLLLVRRRGEGRWVVYSTITYTQPVGCDTFFRPAPHADTRDEKRAYTYNSGISFILINNLIFFSPQPQSSIIVLLFR